MWEEDCIILPINEEKAVRSSACFYNRILNTLAIKRDIFNIVIHWLHMKIIGYIRKAQDFSMLFYSEKLKIFPLDSRTVQGCQLHYSSP